MLLTIKDATVSLWNANLAPVAAKKNVDEKLESKEFFCWGGRFSSVCRIFIPNICKVYYMSASKPGMV